MTRADLLKIIIAAIAGVIIKEIFAWLLKHSKTMGSKAITWLRTHPRYVGLSIEATVLIFMIWVLMFTGDDTRPATRGDVRGFVLLILVFSQQAEQFMRHLREVRDLYHQKELR